MSFIRGEDDVNYFYTSGPGVWNISGGRGTSLRFIIWEHNGLASGVNVSIMDTQSGTATSGLWLEGSGARLISMLNPIFTSGMDGVGANAKPISINYNLIGVTSGLAVVISGGAANAVRAFVGYMPPAA
jgi:hypothetical protein